MLSGNGLRRHYGYDYGYDYGYGTMAQEGGNALGRLWLWLWLWLGSRVGGTMTICYMLCDLCYMLSAKC
jgi:hypothetical protein